MLIAAITSSRGEIQLLKTLVDKLTRGGLKDVTIVRLHDEGLAQFNVSYTVRDNDAIKKIIGAQPTLAVIAFQDGHTIYIYKGHDTSVVDTGSMDNLDFILQVMESEYKARKIMSPQRMTPWPIVIVPALTESQTRYIYGKESQPQI